MADGYARASGRPGVCLTQTIGGANLAAGSRDPYMAGSPVIAITGGTRPMSRYRHVYQEIEDFSLCEPVTKFNAHVDDVRRLPDLLLQTFREATTGAPAPVHLEIQGLSADILTENFEADATTGPQVEPRFATVPAFRPEPDSASLGAALQALRGTQRPIIVAGGGVVTSGAGSKLVELARRLAIPVATSLNAKGVIAETDPLAVGVVGSYSRASANRSVAEADLVFFVGSHTGSQVTDNWRLPAVGTPVVQLDIDPAELGRNYPQCRGAPWRCPSHAASAPRSCRRSARARQAWLAQVQGYVEEWRAAHESMMRSEQVPIRPERLCAELTDLLPDDAILLSDTGHSGIWTGSLIDLRPGQRYLRSAGTLGWALPATLGAKCACPDRSSTCPRSGGTKRSGRTSTASCTGHAPRCAPGSPTARG
jgi:acetolactate synthase I/II/III large subunit